MLPTGQTFGWPLLYFSCQEYIQYYIPCSQQAPVGSHSNIMGKWKKVFIIYFTYILYSVVKFLYDKFSEGHLLNLIE